MNTLDQSTLQVLIVEDEAHDAALVIAEIEKLGWQAAVVNTVQSARAAFADTSFDIVVLDRMLDDSEDGLALLTWFKTLESTVPGVLVASRLGSASDHVAALDLGADDYVNKPYDPMALNARLRALARRLSGKRAPESVVVWEGLEVRLMNRSALWRGEQLSLRPQSFDVLAALATAKGEYLSREALWHSVWASYKRLPPQETVLNTAISRLRGSLAKADSGPIVVSDPLGFRLAMVSE